MPTTANTNHAQMHNLAPTVRKRNLVSSHEKGSPDIGPEGPRRSLVERVTELERDTRELFVDYNKIKEQVFRYLSANAEAERQESTDAKKANETFMKFEDATKMFADIGRIVTMKARKMEEELPRMEKMEAWLHKINAWENAATNNAHPEAKIDELREGAAKLAAKEAEVAALKTSLEEAQALSRKYKDNNDELIQIIQRDIIAPGMAEIQGRGRNIRASNRSMRAIERIEEEQSGMDRETHLSNKRKRTLDQTENE